LPRVLLEFSKPDTYSATLTNCGEGQETKVQQVSCKSRPWYIHTLIFKNGSIGRIS